MLHLIPLITVALASPKVSHHLGLRVEVAADPSTVQQTLRVYAHGVCVYRALGLAFHVRDYTAPGRVLILSEGNKIALLDRRGRIVSSISLSPLDPCPLISSDQFCVFTSGLCAVSADAKGQAFLDWISNTWSYASMNLSTGKTTALPSFLTVGRLLMINGTKLLSVTSPRFLGSSNQGVAFVETDLASNSREVQIVPTQQAIEREIADSVVGGPCPSVRTSGGAVVLNFRRGGRTQIVKLPRSRLTEKLPSRVWPRVYP